MVQPPCGAAVIIMLTICLALVVTVYVLGLEVGRASVKKVLRDTAPDKITPS